MEFIIFNNLHERFDDQNIYVVHCPFLELSASLLMST